MFPLLFGSFLTGLVGGLHCIGMCGGFTAAASVRKGGAIAHATGRVVTYVALGVIGGVLGGVLTSLQWVGFVLTALLLLFFAARLAGLVPETHFQVPIIGRWVRRASRFDSVGGTLAFGMVTALIPCGLVYAALAMPVVAGGPVAGGLAMLCFGLGTMPALLGVGMLGEGIRRIGGWGMGPRRVVAVLVLVGGSWALVSRIPRGAEPPTCHETAESDANVSSSEQSHTTGVQSHTDGVQADPSEEPPCH